MSIASAAAAAVATFPDVQVATPYGTYSLPVVMTAIAGAETGGTFSDSAAGDPASDYPGVPECQGQTSWGLWQIHFVHASYLESVTGSSDPCTWATWLSTPINCARAALAVLGPDVNLSAWTTWNEGTYSAWLAPAQQAVQAVQAAPGSPTTSGENGGQSAGPGILGNLAPLLVVAGFAVGLVVLGVADLRGRL